MNRHTYNMCSARKANGESCTCPPPWNNDHTPSPICPEHGEWCHHCGAAPEPDGDHSCPCLLSDGECLEHTVNRAAAGSSERICSSCGETVNEQGSCWWGDECLPYLSESERKKRGGAA